MKKLLLLSLVLVLGACGFHLRGPSQLPFDTLYVQGGGSQLGPDLQRYLRSGSSVKVVQTPGEAQAVLDILGEGREKRILSLTGGGRVGEFELYYRLSFRLHDGKGTELMPSQQLELKRILPFSDVQVLAKEQEEAMLYREMQNDAVQQVIRRLSALKK
ncbi:MAG: LPS assembly lipoprotein LptE [Sulfurimicrobium sp.]|nr:LPS assembly lipoprotein LptE [Sulfurimicrobium sp.]MDP1704831.1 LPS assembly lipoprotein LptE [Sulfurimicrobium sp.]MDP2200355.1 LPS assembly lipoprotein LptE [Sulfurimicrobium sp.]MDP3689275.1 LPS assembly lipoprotein LptE [Sulfurimicrobium sp.]